MLLKVAGVQPVGISAQGKAIETRIFAPGCPEPNQSGAKERACD
jgi:hypothetical protein